MKYAKYLSAFLLFIGSFYFATDASAANLVERLSGTGTVIGTYATIQACADAVTAGQTCLVYNGTYNERVTFLSGHSGTANAEVVFRAKNPRQVTIVGGFNTKNADYLRIEGFRITNTALWGAPQYSAAGIWVWSDHVSIVNNEFFDIPNYGIMVYSTSVITGTYIANNHFTKIAMGIDASLVDTVDTTIEGNDIEQLYAWEDHEPFTAQAHIDNDYMRAGGKNLVIRGNHFHNTNREDIKFRWKTKNADGSYTYYPVTGSKPNADCFNDGISGYWMVNSRTDGIELVNYSNNNVKDALIENNVFQEVGAPMKPSFYSKPTWTTVPNNVIIRGNGFKNFWTGGLGNIGIDDLQVYNNTFLNEAAFMPGFKVPYGIPMDEYYYTHAGVLNKTKALNNIIMNAYRGFFVPAEYWPDYFYEKSNLIGGQALSVFQYGATYPIDSGTSLLFNKNPLLNSADFSIASNSPAIDAGSALTHVSASDHGSGTALAVDDAGFFHDDRNTVAKSNGLQADWIAVGRTDNTVKISSINYDTDTITLTSAISRNAGDPVYLFKNSYGNQVLYGAKPDVGMYEYPSAAVTPQPCTSHTYTDYSVCSPQGTQTRTLLSSSPEDCVGGVPPVLSQSCTPQSVILLLSASAVNGTITKSPDRDTFSLGEIVTLTATPNRGYAFSSWSGAFSTTTNPLTFTMTGDKTLTAAFIPGVCTEAWSCSPTWSACLNRTQSRTCTDAHNCGTTFSRPAVTQACGSSSAGGGGGGGGSFNAKNSTSTASVSASAPAMTICQFVNLLITINVVPPGRAPLVKAMFGCR